MGYNFFGLIVLAQTDKPIIESAGVSIEGHNENFKMGCGGGIFF